MRRGLCLIRLAHAGYGAPQIAAISGHKDLREIQLYIEQAKREKMRIETSTGFEQAQIANKKPANWGSQLVKTSKR
jgi:hypothetical protein